MNKREAKSVPNRSLATRALSAFGVLVAVVSFSGLVTRFVVSERVAGTFPITVDVQKAYGAPFLRDTFPRERDPSGWFRWSKARSFVVLQNLPAGPIEVLARLRVPRKRVETSIGPPPQIVFTANGATVHRAEPARSPTSISYRFPFQGGALRLGIESETFAAGGRDLGVQLLDIQISPSTKEVSWRRPAAALAAASALTFLAFLITGLSAWGAGLGASAFASGASLLVSERGLVFSYYPTTLITIALASVLVAVGVRVWSGFRHFLTPAQRIVFNATTLVSFVWKIGFITYPILITSDGIFHANRLSRFLNGEWWMTSVTQHQPPFDIPYPFAFFAAGSLLARWGLDLLLVVKLVVVLSETLVVMALMYFAFRFLNDSLTAWLSAAVYQLIPMGALALSAGNFSNVFAMGVGTAALAALLASDTDGGLRRWIPAAVTSFAALTAHFGMLVEGVILWPAWVVSIVWLSPSPANPTHRRQMIWGASLAGVFTVLYYSGYFELLTSQWERALSRDYAMGAGGAAGPLDKLAFNIAFFGETLGLLPLLLALGGAIQILIRGFPTSLHPTIAVWLGATVLFFGIDLFSALEIRYMLQALPLIALLAAYFLAHAWRRGKVGRTAVLLAAGYLLYVSLPVYWDCLMFRYHTL